MQPNRDYLLGIFDAEGCISAQANDGHEHQRVYTNLHCSVAMTHPGAVELFHAEFGGTRRSARMAYNGRFIHTWGVRGGKATEFLEFATRGLTKGPQAVLALHLAKLLKAGRSKGRRPPGSIAVSSAEQAERTKLCAEITSLKEQHVNTGKPVVENLDAYLAGVFDGEGWISAAQRVVPGASRSQTSLLVGIAMQDLAPILLFREKFGGKAYQQPQPSGKIIYSAYLSSGKARAWLEFIRDHCLVKRSQAIEALKLVALLAQQRGGGGSVPRIDDSERQERTALCQQIRKLKFPELEVAS